LSVDLKVLIAKLIRKSDSLLVAEQLLTPRNGVFKVDRKELSSEEIKAVRAFVRLMRKNET
jgi:hypothetical protein